MLKIGVVLAVMAAPVSVSANCALLSNCSTDSQGNSYVTRENLGGGYNTYRNGRLHSQTQQNLSGGYTEEYSDGRRRYYDTNPYERPESSNPYGSRTDPYR